MYEPFLGCGEESIDLIDRANDGGLDTDGMNLTGDNYYITFTLVKILKDRKITVIGTWRSNRGGIPEAAKDKTNRTAPSTITFWNNEPGLESFSLTSYCTNTSKGKP